MSAFSKEAVYKSNTHTKSNSLSVHQCQGYRERITALTNAVGKIGHLTIREWFLLEAVSSYLHWVLLDSCR